MRIEAADLLIAVTGSSDAESACCLIAKQVTVIDDRASRRNPEYNKELGFIKEELGLGDGD